MLSDGSIRCWGRAENGELGYGNKNSVGRDISVADAGPVELPRDIIKITAGSHHTCALESDGQIRCWGDGS